MNQNQRNNFALFSFAVFLGVAVLAWFQPLQSQSVPKVVGIQVLMSDGTIKPFTLGNNLIFQGTTIRQQWVDYYNQPSLPSTDPSGNPIWLLNRPLGWNNLRVFRNGLAQIQYAGQTQTCPAPYVKDPSGNDITSVVLGDFTFTRSPGTIIPRYTVDGTPAGAPLYGCDGTQFFNWNPTDLVIASYRY